MPKTWPRHSRLRPTQSSSSLPARPKPIGAALALARDVCRPACCKRHLECADQPSCRRVRREIAMLGCANANECTGYVAVVRAAALDSRLSSSTSERGAAWQTSFFPLSVTPTVPGYSRDESAWRVWSVEQSANEAIASAGVRRARASSSVSASSNFARAMASGTEMGSRLRCRAGGSMARWAESSAGVLEQGSDGWGG